MEWINFVFVKALGLTLFHSIWQGTLIALMMSVILSLIAKKKAKSRYLIAFSALVLVFLSSMITFSYLYQPSEQAMKLTTFADLTQDYGEIVLVFADDQLITSIKRVLLANIQWITFVWALGMLFFLFKIFFGMYRMSRLEQTSRAINLPWLDQCFETLQTKAQFFKPIGLRESLYISQPSVVGFLKPIIYFPIGMVNQIGPKEVEAILAHELAHIIRNDFLINLIQSFIETFYYFHPAIWWISANIRNERENACDDLAIDITGDRIRYAKSLVTLQELEYKENYGLAMTLTSKASPLFDRIKRILNQPKNRHDMKQKLFATLLLIPSIIWISATEPLQPKSEEKSSPKTEITAQDEQVEQQSPIVVMDTIPEPKKKSKSAVIEIKDGEIKRLEIDGVEIPEDEYDEHGDIFGNEGSSKIWMWDTTDFGAHKLLKDMNLQMSEDFDHYFEFRHDGEHFDSIWSNRADADHILRFRSNVSDFDSILAHIDIPQHHFDFDFHHLDSLRSNMESFRFDMEELSDDLGVMRFEFRDMIDSFDFPSMGSDLRFFFDTSDHRALREDLDGIQFHYFDRDSDLFANNNLQNAFIKELRKDGLYKEGPNDILLSDQELRINGQQQGEEMLEKYKQIYEKNTGVELMEGSTINMKLTDSNKKRRIMRL